MRSSFRALLRSGCFLALLLGSLEVAAQDYEAQFVNGIKAMDRRSWKEAISYFRAAIAARSRESTDPDLVQIYGMQTRPYLPHFYLGVAYASSGNCDDALQQFDESEQQGAVQKFGEYKSLLRLREECRVPTARVTTPKPIETAPAPASAAVVPAPPTQAAVAVPSTQMPLPSPTENGLAAQSLRDAQTEIARAAAGATVEGRLRETSVNSGTWQKDPSLETRHARATDDLAAARAALEEGRARGDVSRLREARDIALRANQEFGDLQRLLLAARLTGGPTPPLPKEINTSLRTTPSPRVATALPQNAARVPPPLLLEGVRAYFSGDYARAARTLESIPDFNDRHAVAEAMLIRSAARYALFVICGKKDSGLEKRARQDVTDCHRLDPRVSPRPKVFSPRFVEFFAQVTEEPSPIAN